MRTSVKLHYGWIIVAVTFTALLVSAGIRAAPGVLIVPLENEFHWSRATISFAVGVNILLTGLVGPFAAAVMDRFGVRRTMALALALTAAGVALTPMMRQPWQLVFLMGAVVLLTLQAIAINRLAGIPYPLWNPVHESSDVAKKTGAQT